MNHIEQLQGTIRRIHGVDSTHVESVTVMESFRGEIMWDGQVEVFELHGHPKTDRAYAWMVEGDNPDHPQRHITVLHLSPVTSASLAVRAAIVEDYRKRERPREN
jgi:hypothetical protein